MNEVSLIVVAAIDGDLRPVCSTTASGIRQSTLKAEKTAVSLWRDADGRFELLDEAFRAEADLAVYCCNAELIGVVAERF